MKKKSTLVVSVIILSLIILLSFLVPTKKLKEVEEENYSAAVYNFLFETETGDIIDPTFSFVSADEVFYFQFDGLIESSEILGLDVVEGKSDEELKELDEFFEILMKVDGEWIELENSNELKEKLSELKKYTKEIVPISSDFRPSSYIPYEDFVADYDMDKFTKMFYNIIDERIIEGKA